MNARKKLDELKDLWGLRTDEELANKLNIPKNTINTWIRRGSIPEKWELKIIQMNDKSIVGNSNIQVIGHKNSVNSTSNQKYSELFELIEQYATPKLIEEFKFKLLKIKEVVDA